MAKDQKAARETLRMANGEMRETRRQQGEHCELRKTGRQMAVERLQGSTAALGLVEVVALAQVFNADSNVGHRGKVEMW